MLFRNLCILLFLTLVTAPGCSKKDPITGKEFLTKEMLVDVLVDIHLVDGITNDRKFYRRYPDVDSIDVLGPILEKYQISKHMFDTTMYTYSHRPDLFDLVYNEVLVKLNILMDENDQGNPELNTLEE